jgi:hypothetical protein
MTQPICPGWGLCLCVNLGGDVDLQSAGVSLECPLWRAIAVASHKSASATEMESEHMRNTGTRRHATQLIADAVSDLSTVASNMSSNHFAGLSPCLGSFTLVMVLVPAEIVVHGVSD